jgi:hypothetical protein
LNDGITESKTSDPAELQQPGSGSLVRDLFVFLRHYKKWWLLPIVAMLILVGTIALLSGKAVPPFVYTIF